jgi:hypothetical protein
LESPRQIFELLKPKSLKALIIMRDYAERAWSAYNFWCEPRIDAKCEKLGQWVTKDHYRSPEMFHELILAQYRQIALDLWFPTLLREAPRYYRDNIRQYADHPLISRRYNTQDHKGEASYQSSRESKPTVSHQRESSHASSNS